MNHFFIRIILCIFIGGFTLFLFVNKQNELTKLRIELPKLEKDVRHLQEETKRLQYEVESFENPVHLIELSQKPEFGHLKHPLEKEIIVIERPKVGK